MSRTDTDVIVTEYRAEFRAEPFARPRWTIVGGMEYKTVLPKRRRHTVAREYDSDGKRTEPAAKVPDTGIGHIHESMLLDSAAVVVFVPDSAAARTGHAIVLEQIARGQACRKCGVRALSPADMRNHVLTYHR